MMILGMGRIVIILGDAQHCNLTEMAEKEKMGAEREKDMEAAIYCLEGGDERIPVLTYEALNGADGILFGICAYYGASSYSLKSVLDKMAENGAQQWIQ